MVKPVIILNDSFKSIFIRPRNSKKVIFESFFWHSSSNNKSEIKHILNEYLLKKSNFRILANKDSTDFLMLIINQTPEPEQEIEETVREDKAKILCSKCHCEATPIKKITLNNENLTPIKPMNDFNKKYQIRIPK